MVLGFSSWAGKVRSRKVDESGLHGWVSGFNGNLWPGRKDAVSLRRDSSAMLGMTLRVRFLRYGRNDRWVRISEQPTRLPVQKSSGESAACTGCCLLSGLHRKVAGVRHR